MTTYEWISTFLIPVTGIVSWIAGSRLRRNDTLKAMQTTVGLCRKTVSCTRNCCACARRTTCCVTKALSATTRSKC